MPRRGRLELVLLVVGRCERSVSETLRLERIATLDAGTDGRGGASPSTSLVRRRRHR
jgi:hypothetical protein